MLDGDRRRIEMAYALQFTLPGTPVIRYGDEIGMGDDLTQPEREAIRTTMQWSSRPNGGFSGASPDDVHFPTIDAGKYAYQDVNVAEQERDPDSLLSWFSRALHTLRQCPEFGAGTCHYIDTGNRAVLALIHDAPGGTMLALTNLSSDAHRIELGPQRQQDDDHARDVFADHAYEPATPKLTGLELRPYGYRWIRLRQTLGR